VLDRWVNEQEHEWSWKIYEGMKDIKIIHMFIQPLKRPGGGPHKGKTETRANSKTCLQLREGRAGKKRVVSVRRLREAILLKEMDAWCEGKGYHGVAGNPRRAKSHGKH